MATAAQFEANRLNAQKSTGPRSPEGKAASRFNALKHGADARSRIIPGESEDELLGISRQYHDEFQPESIAEVALVDTLVQCHWEKRRVPRLEAAAIAAYVAKQEKTGDSDLALGAALIRDASGPNLLQKLYRRAQTANRDWTRALAELRKLQSARTSTSPKPSAAPDPERVRNEPNPAPAPEEPAAAKNEANSKPAQPRGFNPNNALHPPIETCPT